MDVTVEGAIGRSREKGMSSARTSAIGGSVDPATLRKGVNAPFECVGPRDWLHWVASQSYW